MADWYFYHSQNTMGQTYHISGESAVYSKLENKKLCFGDRIWVIEGDLGQPVRFSLVDCFIYAENIHPPFSSPFYGFRIKYRGESLKPPEVRLNKSDSPWFSQLHSKYITKQRFFERIIDVEILDGLNASV